MKRIERVRLYPTPRQERALGFVLDVTRELYNALLQERRDAYRLRGVRVTAKEQYAEITALRQPWGRIDRRLAAVYREVEDVRACTASIWRLRHSFDAASAARSPAFRALSRRSAGTRSSFRTATARYTSTGGNAASRSPALERSSCAKAVRFRPLRARGWSGAIGRWYGCFECERAVHPLAPSATIVGIDRGVHVLAALSDGTLIANRGIGERRRAATARLQRELEATSRSAMPPAGCATPAMRSARQRCGDWPAPRSAKPTRDEIARTRSRERSSTALGPSPWRS